MLAYCLGLGGFWAGCHPGSPALDAPASAVLSGPAFTQVSPLVMAAPGPTRTFWAGWLGWLCRVLMCILVSCNRKIRLL